MKQSTQVPAAPAQEPKESEPVTAPDPAVDLPKAKQVITLPDGTIRVDL